jgi:predicted metal-dependent hydrolase
VEFAPGVVLLLGGEPHVIRHEPRARGGAFLEGRAIVVTGAREFLGRRVADFLRREAKRRIAALAQPHAAALGVALRPIRVKDTRSRWGSCAPDGTDSLSPHRDAAVEWLRAEGPALLRVG